MEWIMSTSDLSAADLKKARSEDKDATFIIVSAGTQIPLTFRLHADLNSKQILPTYLTLRHDRAGNRLNNFKAKGFLAPDGALCFKDFSFKLAFKDLPSKELDSISHALLIDKEVPSPGPWATCDSDFESFWDDYGASIKINGMPKVLLHTFFGTAFMKFGYSPCNAKNPTFKAEVAMCVKTQVDKARAVAVPDMQSPLKAEIKQLDREENQAKMSKVAEQMQAKVAQRKNKRKLSLSPGASSAAAASDAE